MTLYVMAIPILSLTIQLVHLPPERYGTGRTGTGAAQKTTTGGGLYPTIVQDYPYYIFQAGWDTRRYFDAVNDHVQTDAEWANTIATQITPYGYTPETYRLALISAYGMDPVTGAGQIWTTTTPGDGKDVRYRSFSGSIDYSWPSTTGRGLATQVIGMQAFYSDFSDQHIPGLAIDINGGNLVLYSGDSSVAATPIGTLSSPSTWRTITFSGSINQSGYQFTWSMGGYSKTVSYAASSSPIQAKFVAILSDPTTNKQVFDNLSITYSDPLNTSFTAKLVLAAPVVIPEVDPGLPKGRFGSPVLS